MGGVPLTYSGGSPIVDKMQVAVPRQNVAVPWTSMALCCPSCGALGTNFGESFSLAPPRRAQFQPRSLRGATQELHAAGGRAQREVVPEFVPSAPQDGKFPPRLVWSHWRGEMYCVKCVG